MLSRSLHAKLLLPLLLAGIVIGSAGAWLTYQSALAEIRHQLVHRGYLLGATIDQSFRIAAQEFEIRLAVEELIWQQLGISRITLATGDPFTVWASSFHPGLDPDKATQEMLFTLSDAIEHGRFGHMFLADGDLVLVLPVGSDQARFDSRVVLKEPLESFQLPPGEYQGAVYLQFDWQSIEEDAAAMLVRSLGVFLAIIVFLMLIVLFLLRSVVLKRVEVIGEAIGRYKDGNLDARVKSTSVDEIGIVASSFDEMLNSLADSQEMFHRIFRAGPGTFRSVATGGRYAL